MVMIECFDANATAYDVWFDENQTIYQAEIEAIKSFVPATGKGVEIGVGTGRFAASLGITIGVEPSPRMSQLAKQRGIEVILGKGSFTVVRAIKAETEERFPFNEY